MKYYNDTEGIIVALILMARVRNSKPAFKK